MQKLEFNDEELAELFKDRRKNISQILKREIKRKKVRSLNELINNSPSKYLMEESDDDENEKILSIDSLKFAYYNKRIPKETTIHKIGKVLEIPELESDLGFMSYGLDFIFGYLSSLYSDGDIEGSGYFDSNHKTEVEDFLLKLFHMNIKNRVFLCGNINSFNILFSKLNYSEWTFLLTLSELNSIQIDLLQDVLTRLKLKPKKEHLQNKLLDEIFIKFSKFKQSDKTISLLDSIEPLRNYFKNEPSAIKNFLPLEVDILTMENIEKNLFSIFLSFQEDSKEKNLIISLAEYIKTSI